MSVFHHKGLLVDASESSVRYRFYPDHVEAPDVRGLFILDTTTWSARVLKSTDDRREQHCVSALAHKIRRAFESCGALPATVSFIA